MSACLFYTASDVSNFLGISRSRAYVVIRALNEELASKGYITIAGRIPKKFFAEKYYGMASA